MKHKYGPLIAFITLCIISCSEKQETSSSQHSTETFYTSEITIPDIKSSEVRAIAQDYDELTHKALVHSQAHKGKLDKDFLAEFEKDMEIAERKMEETMESASARDAALLQKYMLAKKKELEEQTSFIDY